MKWLFIGGFCIVVLSVMAGFGTRIYNDYQDNQSAERKLLEKQVEYQRQQAQATLDQNKKMQEQIEAQKPIQTSQTTVSQPTSTTPKTLPKYEPTTPTYASPAIKETPKPNFESVSPVPAYTPPESYKIPCTEHLQPDGAGGWVKSCF